MKWLAPHFDPDEIAPADYVLSRLVQYLRADAKLLEIFQATTSPANKIQLVPFGRWLDMGNPPLMIVTLPRFDRQPAPNIYTENIRVRIVVRYHSEEVRPTGQEQVLEPSIATLASYIIKVVTDKSTGAFQLVTVVDGTPRPIVRRVDLTEVALEEVEPGTGQGSDNLLDLRMDFIYAGLVEKNLHVLYPLLTS